jgi:hypothetical protein
MILIGKALARNWRGLFVLLPPIFFKKTELANEQRFVYIPYVRKISAISQKYHQLSERSIYASIHFNFGMGVHDRLRLFKKG